MSEIYRQHPNYWLTDLITFRHVSGNPFGIMLQKPFNFKANVVCFWSAGGQNVSYPGDRNFFTEF